MAICDDNDFLVRDRVLLYARGLDIPAKESVDIALESLKRCRSEHPDYAEALEHLHAVLAERGLELKLENAENSGEVTGTYYTGGIVGYYQLRPEDGIASFKNLKNTGNITGTESIGGMLGLMKNNGVCNFANIESSAKITGSASYVGGLIGRISQNDNDCDGNPFDGSGERSTAITLDRAFSAGPVEGVSYVGGIAGYMNGTAYRCTNNGDVFGASGFSLTRQEPLRRTAAGIER